MAELGQTSDPKALVPGDVQAIYATEGALIQYGDLLHEAGAGLARIDTSDGWSGAAADAFRQAFTGQPGKWLQAGDAFHDAANALDDYAGTLAWAQDQAIDAINLWTLDGANQQAARDTLANARANLDSAGNTAAMKVGAARDLAPPRPGFWDQVGSFFSGAGSDLASVGETAVNDIASVGNAAINDPGSLAETAGGMLLAGVSSLGDGVGAVLDATGIGLPAGAALGAVSTTGVVAGLGLAGAGASTILNDAAGADRADIMESRANAGSGGGAPRSGDSVPKTNQEIADQAKALGYDRKVRYGSAPFDSHGEPVFTDGKNFLTPDRDGHNVANGWKLVNRRGTRLGTYTWDLTRVRD